MSKPEFNLMNDVKTFNHSKERDHEASLHLDQALMKFEDLRSFELRNNSLFLISAMNSQKTKEAKEIEIGNLYNFHDDLKNFIENLEDSSRVIELGGVLFKVAKSQSSLPAKQRFLSEFRSEENITDSDIELINQKKSFFFPDEIFKDFLSDLKKNIGDSYKDLECDSADIENKEKIGNDCHPEKDQNKKVYHDKCEGVSKDFQVNDKDKSQSENDIFSKYQQIIDMESEMKFRCEELDSLEESYLRSRSELQMKIRSLKETENQVDKDQKKLNLMKKIFKSRIREITKINPQKIELSRSNSISKDSKYIRNISRSILSFSELEENDMPTPELSLDSSISSQNSAQVSQLISKLSNFRSQKYAQHSSKPSNSSDYLNSASSEVFPRLSYLCDPLKNNIDIEKDGISTRVFHLATSENYISHIETDLDQLKTLESTYDSKIRELEKLKYLHKYNFSSSEEDIFPSFPVSSQDLQIN